MFYIERSLGLVVHGDDFTVLGWECQLDWHREKVTGRFESKVKWRIGPASGDDKSMRVLNRLVHWTSEGIEQEADQRHAELIIQELSFKADIKKVSIRLRGPSKEKRTRLRNMMRNWIGQRVHCIEV